VAKALSEETRQSRSAIDLKRTLSPSAPDDSTVHSRTYELLDQRALTVGMLTIPLNECIGLIASAEDHGQVDQGTLADL
jgi:hypothetical protein